MFNKLPRHKAEEKLIEEVRKYPALWDPQHTQYKNFSGREIIWSEIGIRLKASSTECKKKWRNMRDCYMRCKKMYILNGNSDKTIKWRHYNRLQFLKDWVPADSILIPKDKQPKEPGELKNILAEVSDDEDDSLASLSDNSFKSIEKKVKLSEEPQIAYTLEDDTIKMLEFPKSLRIRKVTTMEEDHKDFTDFEESLMIPVDDDSVYNAEETTSMPSEDEFMNEDETKTVPKTEDFEYNTDDDNYFEYENEEFTKIPINKIVKNSGKGRKRLRMRKTERLTNKNLLEALTASTLSIQNVTKTLQDRSGPIAAFFHSLSEAIISSDMPRDALLGLQQDLSNITYTALMKWEEEKRGAEGITNKRTSNYSRK